MVAMPIITPKIVNIDRDLRVFMDPIAYKTSSRNFKVCVLLVVLSWISTGILPLLLRPLHPPQLRPLAVVQLGVVVSLQVMLLRRVNTTIYDVI